MASSPPPTTAVTLARRRDSPTRGRHVVATTAVEHGRLLWIERPLLALPSLPQQQCRGLVCHGCHAFVGGPHVYLSSLSSAQGPVNGTTTTTDDITVVQNNNHQNHTAHGKDGCVDDSDEEASTECEAGHDYTVIPCRLSCGRVYCSTVCEATTWHAHHKYLCTGGIPDGSDGTTAPVDSAEPVRGAVDPDGTHQDDDDNNNTSETNTRRSVEAHPLVQFLEYSVHTNEILLLVAQWWVAQHVVEARRASAAESSEHNQNSNDVDDTVSTKATEASLADADPYTDFVMPLWWDVAVLDHHDASVPRDSVGADALQRSLKDVCATAADLLSRALANVPSVNATAKDDSADESSTRMIRDRLWSIPPLTANDVAVRIGACEQNAMGIRQRHALCRSVFDPEVRRRNHKAVIQCLADAGFIGGGDELSDDDGDDENENNPKKEKKEEQCGSVNTEVDLNDKEEEWDYSVEEIATFLSNLYMNEDGSVEDQSNDNPPIQEDRQFDDLDMIFPPLDGTAMYSLACKMNHSCDPNVILIYKRQAGWGYRHPLVAQIVALRDIRPDEELTISYIDAQVSYSERQAALANYGFSCTCSKCLREMNGGIPNDGACMDAHAENNLFGSDSEDDDDDDYSIPQTAPHNENIVSAEADLEQRLNRLDSMANISKFGNIPLNCLAPAVAFVIQTTLEITNGAEGCDDDNNNMLPRTQSCVQAAQLRDYSMCKIVGSGLEESLFTILQRETHWSRSWYRPAYWCAVLVACMGYTHESDFITAQNALDKALILGLPRSDDRLGSFVDFVESYSAQVAMGPHRTLPLAVIPNYRDVAIAAVVQTSGLSQPIRFPVDETEETPVFKCFYSDHVSSSKPLVIRNFAANWPALKKWRDIEYLDHAHGHRLVPIELGSMLNSTLTEHIVTFRHFMHIYVLRSSETISWSLGQCSGTPSHIAYLAQHPLTSQIAPLQKDIDIHPQLTGSAGPSHIYMWMGTGGTRTSLHCDSYDNLFVQLVGAKYVRLYSSQESPEHLYINTETILGSQGNMSDIDCEKEDWSKHVHAKSLLYKEVLLLPGDCLFIPAGTWHYIRSLSTSTSVNYWF